uniref:Zgc:55943 n=1 Tax=Hucho hucho TaxID=62062 RepID=A0A4W5PNB6_9TELE
MGCTSAKQVSAVPSGEEGRSKAYSNGDLLSDEYKKGVEKVKYINGEEDRLNTCNQDSTEKTALLPRVQHTDDTGSNDNGKTHIHSSESQQEFFRMLDEKIEKGQDYCSEEEDMT